MPDDPPTDVTWGLIARESRYGDGTWPMLADSLPNLPRTEWKTIRNRHYVKHIFRQLDGHCAANAATAALMCVRAMQGQPDMILAPESLYMQHSVWGTGSSLEENLRQLSAVGVLTRDTFPQQKAPRGTWSPSKWESAWVEEAKQYRIAEWFDLDGNFDNLCTALQHGFVCVIGLRWPGGGGHSVLATDLARVDGAWVVEGPNSWGTTWNGDGFFRLTENNLRSGPGYGSWAARSAVFSG